MIRALEDDPVQYKVVNQVVGDGVLDIRAFTATAQIFYI